MGWKPQIQPDLRKGSSPTVSHFASGGTKWGIGFKDIYFYVHDCSACMGVHVQCLKQPEEGTRSPRSGITDGRELPCEGWELSPGLKETKVQVSKVRHKTMNLISE